MANVQCRLISFKQDPDEPEYIYALSDRIPKINDWVYVRELGKFACLQKVLHKDQLSNKYPVIEATSRDDKDMPKLPCAIETQYWESNKELKTIMLRTK